MNFYDDSTHQNCPKWNKVIGILNDKNITISYACKNYKPIVYWTIGKLNEKKSVRQGKTLRGTWEYYGFESTIWGKKER